MDEREPARVDRANEIRSQEGLARSENELAGLARGQKDLAGLARGQQELARGENELARGEHALARGENALARRENALALREAALAHRENAALTAEAVTLPIVTLPIVTLGPVTLRTVPLQTVSLETVSLETVSLETVEHAQRTESGASKAVSALHLDASQQLAVPSPSGFAPPRGSEPVAAPRPDSLAAPEALSLRSGAGEAGARPDAAATDALNPLPQEALATLWRELQHAIRARVEPAQFATWFQRAILVRADDTSLCVGVQNDFSRDWLERYYGEALALGTREVLGSARRIEVVVVPELALPHARRSSDDDSASTSANERGLSSSNDDRDSNGARRSDAQRGADAIRGLGLAAELGLNPKYTFDNFVVGPCNRFAHAAAMGAAEQPGKAYNPFFLHGSVGLGKTHLLQSMCFAILARNPKSRILYLSCETFVNHFISALENGDITEFRNKYRSVDVLVVDDIQVLANKERTQEEFFHTFNTLHQQGKQIVLSSDGPPRDIPTLQERLVSRFKWGLVTEMEPPCYETRMAILKRKSRERGRELPDDVAALLGERIESNIRELEGAVTRLLGFANVSGSPLTCDFAREVLRDLFTARRAQPAMGDILALVTAHFDVKLSELQSKRRTAAVVLPRQVAMYIARRITRHSLEEIGTYFGGRDHSTVLYGIEKIETLRASDVTLREIVDGFLARLQVRPV